MTANHQLPSGFSSQMINCNGIQLHVVHNGASFEGSPIQDERPALLCLHGFPEFWMCWEKVMEQLADDYFMVVPDQRGFNKSDAPAGVSHYQAKKAVADALSLADQLFGERSFYLAGHDFGAAIAYAFAFSFPERIQKLIIVNGAHPVCLQEALLDDPLQAEASQYFHTLRAERAGAKAAENDFQLPFNILQSTSSNVWLTANIKDRFRKAWQGPDRLEAMFNWYRASPIVVPVPNTPTPNAPLYGATRTKLRVSMPHLLIWGVRDTAFLPSARQSLPEFCDNLTIKEVQEADHWILHTHGEVVAEHIGSFLRA